MSTGAVLVETGASQWDSTANASVEPSLERERAERGPFDI
jgi:hypothetical protein